jgi:hypothetical protein
VEEAYPCQSLEEADNMNVEIDPVSEIMVTETIKSRGLRVVGWYHSHPLFQPDPSTRDLHTQKSYQQLVKDEASGHEVFVGAIAAIYDERLPSQESVFNWFWSGTVPSSTNGGEGGRNSRDTPFAFPHRVVYNKDLPWETVLEMV